MNKHSWMKSPEEDAAMQEEHLPYWQAMIKSMPEQDLTRMTILDFGCNQGGFLQLLFNLRPFKAAVGIDAVDSAIEIARKKCAGLPVEFKVDTSVGRFKAHFDLAFSHEVLYLLPDLSFHAREMFTALKTEGIYYASMGAHLENPLWPRWRRYLKHQANIPPQDYSLEDVVEAFISAGFEVEARRFRIEAFHPYNPETDKIYYPSLMAKLDYFDRDKILFRFVKRSK